jgi:hypothetical protein
MDISKELTEVMVNEALGKKGDGTYEKVLFTFLESNNIKKDYVYIVYICVYYTEV